MRTVKLIQFGIRIKKFKIINFDKIKENSPYQRIFIDTVSVDFKFF